MEKQKIEFKTTFPFKLRDKANKNVQILHVKEVFGFIPETIVIERSTTHKNTFVVHAPTPDSQKEYFVAKK